MAEPFAIVSSTAGLVSLGIQVFSGILKYIDALKSREQDLSYAKQHGHDLQNLLNRIKACVGEPNSDDSDAVILARAHLTTCETELRAFHDLITKLTGFNKAGPSYEAGSGETESNITSSGKSRTKSFTKKVRYHFDRPKLQLFEERLSRANWAMLVALTLLDL